MNSNPFNVPFKSIRPVVAFDVEFVRGPRIFVTKKKPKFINLPISAAVVDIYDQTMRICYKTFVKPFAEVTNYNSPITGLIRGEITDAILADAPSFDEVKGNLQTIFQDRKIIIMGGSQDFEVFGINIKFYDTVDISEYLVDDKGQSVSIRRLIKGLYNIDLPENGIHDPSYDAYWTLRLYFDFVATGENGECKKMVVDVPKEPKLNWHTRYRYREIESEESSSSCFDDFDDWKDTLSNISASSS